MRPKMADLTTVTWIRGPSLDRLTVVSTAAGVHHCIVRALRNTERDGGCDGCPRRHSPANLMCAMNTKGVTFATEAAFYDFHSRRLVPGEWHLVDIQTFSGSLSRESWRRVAAVAAAATGAKLVGM